MKNTVLRVTIINGILVAMALILSYVERLFPIGLIVPIPGIKIGLANIITIFSLFFLDIASTLIVIVVRCTISSLLFGSLPSFLFSISGSLMALIVMVLFLKGYNRYFSMVGISIAGAAAHNIGQILIASFLLRSSAVLPYLSILLFSSIITGTLTGVASGKVIEHLGKIGITKESLYNKFFKI